MSYPRINKTLYEDSYERTFTRTELRSFLKSVEKYEKSCDDDESILNCVGIAALVIGIFCLPLGAVYGATSYYASKQNSWRKGLIRKMKRELQNAYYVFDDDIDRIKLEVTVDVCEVQPRIWKCVEEAFVKDTYLTGIHYSHGGWSNYI